MRKIPFLVALALLGSPLTPADAAVKSGASCKKPGAVSIVKAVEYTCKKKGKKLVWSKGTPLFQTSKTDQPSSSETSPNSPKKVDPAPAPTNAVPNEALLVQSLFEELWKSPVKSKTNYKVIVEPAQSDSEWARRQIEIADASIDVLAKLDVDITTDSTIYIGWGFSWLNNYMPKNSWCYDATWSAGGSCGEGILFLNLAKTEQHVRTPVQGETITSPRVEFVPISVMSHELAHQAQRDFAERYRQIGVSFYPAWIREGAAELLKIAVYAHFKGISYVEARKIYLYTGFTYQGCGAFRLREMLMSNNHPSNCNYTGGMLASEYLVATTKDLRSLFTFAASKIEGNGPNFDNQTGISLDTYRYAMNEIFGLDIDVWDLAAERYVKTWAP